MVPPLTGPRVATVPTTRLCLKDVRIMKRIIIIAVMALLCGCIKEKQTDVDLKAGDSIPRFRVEMNDGSIVTDEDLKGRISVVMFFHTSCPDCQQALPRVQQLYDEYASERVVFTLISREEGEDEIMSFWKDKGLKMPFSAQNDRKVYEKFAKTRIPRIYMNDKDGIIRHIFTDDPVPSYDELKISLESLIR